MNLNPVAVELDLMDPALARRHLDRRRQRGFDEPRVGCFHTDCRRKSGEFMAVKKPAKDTKAAQNSRACGWRRRSRKRPPLEAGAKA